MKPKIKSENLRRRLRRSAGIRKKLSGTKVRPRLSIFRSSKHIYAQLIDDAGGITMAAASTRDKDLRDAVKEMKKVAQAEKVGARLAEMAKAQGIESVVFDRKGWVFHGRVAALAKGARLGGLKF